MNDKNHPIVLGILNYLAMGIDFDGHTWANIVVSNNDYPHAPWWHFESSTEVSYNPTACFIGFILKFADENSSLYELAVVLAKEAYAYFKMSFPMESMHTVSCFVELYEYLKESALHDILDLGEFRNLLQEQIHHVLTYDTSKWGLIMCVSLLCLLGLKRVIFIGIIVNYAIMSVSLFCIRKI